MPTSSSVFASRTPPAYLARYAALVHLTIAAGLVVSAMTAVLIYSTPELYRALFGGEGLTFAGWLVTLSPLAIVLLFGGNADRLSVGAARFLFLLFSVLTGASLSSLLAAYTPASIVGTFIAGAAGYAMLALAGFTTARDLSGLGKFMIVALFGLIAAMLINLLIGSSGADLLFAVIGIGVFAALVAVDSQRVRMIFQADGGGEAAERLAILGALTLYLDFLNLFLWLIRLAGRRRDWS